MNIYITTDSFEGSARNLDNTRLSHQILHLSQILSNIFHTTNLYDSILDEKIIRYSKPNCSYRSCLLPKKYENHSTVAWGIKTPIHTLFLLRYSIDCRGVLISRGGGMGAQKIKDMLNVAVGVYNAVSKVVQTMKLPELYGLSKELYRNIPNEFENEPDTILAYRKYLTSQWKKDIIDFETSKVKQTAWLLENANVAAPTSSKPRLSKNPVWRNGLPIFAREEIKALREELRNANNNS